MSDLRRVWLETQRRAAEADDLSRRHFVKLLGASVALAGLDGCTRLPSERILPYVDQPELTPGIPQHYATAMTIDGFATGLLVESHDGRPTKIEGNPEHPASLGAAGILEQASVLQLYDPYRARHVRQGKERSTWDAFASAFAPAALRQRVGARGERLHLLLEPTSSPLDAELLRRLQELYPAAGVHVHAPAATAWGEEPYRSGTRAVLPQYDVGAADVLLAVDSDFLSSEPLHLRYARDFAARRRPETSPNGMNRLYVLEPSVTVTGSVADHRLAVRPSEIEPFLQQLLSALTSASVPAASTDSGSARFVRAVASDLVAHRGRSVIIAGPRLSAHAHALVLALNAAAGNVDRTVFFIQSPLFGAGDPRHSLGALADALRGGAVDTLICLGGNPCYATSGSVDFTALVRRAAQRAYLGLYENETARECQWMIPAAHYLEAWGDTRAYDGSLSIVQPLLAPLYGGKTVADVLAVLVGDASLTAYDLLRADWGRRGATEESWRSALGHGVAPNSHAPRVAAPSPDLKSQHVVVSSSRDIELTFAPDARVHDGAFANNAWLQELPDPITTLTWGNAAWLSRATADRLRVATEDVIRVRSGNETLELPAIVVPGHADDVLSLHFGYGRSGAEETARDVGTRVHSLWGGTSGVARATVEATGRRVPLAMTQRHWSLEPAAAARTMSLGEVERAQVPQRSRALSLYEPPATLPDGPAQHQWAMTIDLSACIGCGTCAVACQAENNVPVVGAEDVRKGREMHWLRIDRYAVGDAAGGPATIAQPMLCQQCEKAPCEYVCPVEATVHSPDGLNEMIYNRCVGTRFCSNNCPYKVRRFNWFDYNGRLTPTEVLVKNPDVTVRERGVMEKCTFCVQRIREAEITASAAGRPLQTDEVRTACQQACPTNAIVFGSLTDPNAAVLRGRDGPRAYTVLDSLGTSPRVRYLARVRNPNPALEG